MKKKPFFSYAGSVKTTVQNANMIICRCEEVNLGEILNAIAEGAITVDEVKKRTRAGMGLCQGRSCGRIIQKLISKNTGAKLEHIKPGRIRPPVRPLPLSALINSKDDIDA